jgi:hypothetical protein
MMHIVYVDTSQYSITTSTTSSSSTIGITTNSDPSSTSTGICNTRVNDRYLIARHNSIDEDVIDTIIMDTIVME